MDGICLLLTYGSILLFLLVAGAWYQDSEARLRRRLAEGKGLEAAVRIVGGRVERRQGREWPVLDFERGGRRWGLTEWVIASSGKVMVGLETAVAGESFFDALSKTSCRNVTAPPRLHPVWPDQDHFRVCTADPSWADHLRSVGLDKALLDLDAWARVPVHLRLTNSGLLLELEAILDPGWIVKILEHAERIAQFCTAPDAGGSVEIVEERQEAGGICQVCSSPMDGTVVRCEVCRTPHHADCWEYLGRCSTFACPGKRATG